MARSRWRTSVALFATTAMTAGGIGLVSGVPAAATPAARGLSDPAVERSAPFAAALRAYDPTRPESARAATAAWVASAFGEAADTSVAPAPRGVGEPRPQQTSEPCALPVPVLGCILGGGSPNPEPTSMEAVRVDVTVSGYASGHDARDLDADGGHDVFAVSIDGADQRIVALRGSDGTPLYSRRLPDRDHEGPWEIEIPAGDLDGDGTDDLLVIEQSWRWSRYPQDARTQRCYDMCGERESQASTHRWSLALRRGRDGGISWRRSWHGRSEAEEDWSSSLTGSSSDVRYASTNAWLLVHLIADQDGDGMTDVLTTTADISGHTSETWGPGGVLWSGTSTTRNTTRGWVLRGADGRRLAERVLADAPALAVLQPAGDVTGDGRGDLLWQVHRREDDTVSCVALGVCLDPSDIRRSVSATVLDGRGVVPVWSRTYVQAEDPQSSFYGYEGPVIWVEPLLADATGDGRGDLLLHDIDFNAEVPYLLRLLDGASGTARWTRDDEWSVQVIGPVGGGRGVDFFAMSQGGGENDATSVFQRIDGATGDLLFATSRPARYDGESFWFSHPEVVADVDDDGVRDLVVRTEQFSEGQSSTQTLTIEVESGASGAELLERTPDAGYVSVTPAGDVDGDGRPELLVSSTDWSDSSRPDSTTDVVRVRDGAVLWTSSALRVVPGGDQDGQPGEELIVTDLDHPAPDRAEMRVSSVDGATGRVRWTVPAAGS